MQNTNMAGSDLDDEDALDPSEQLNRPLDTAFNQQRIPAWSPILDPTWVIIGLFYLGVIMVPVGTYKFVLKLRRSTTEQSVLFIFPSISTTLNYSSFRLQD